MRFSKKMPAQVCEILEENVGLKMRRNAFYNQTSVSGNKEQAQDLNSVACAWSDQYTENIKRIADIYLDLGNQKMYDLYIKLYQGRKLFNVAHYSTRFESVEKQINKYIQAESMGYPCSSNISVMYGDIGDFDNEYVYLKRAVKNQRNKKKLDPLGVDEFEIWAYKNLAIYHLKRKNTLRSTLCYFLAYWYGDKTDWPLKLIFPLLLRIRNKDIDSI